MNIIRASEEFKFQVSPEGFISPTFYCFNYKSKEEFINHVKKKIQEFPYLLYFDGGECLLHLNDEQSKQLFFDCLDDYYDNFYIKDYEKTFREIIRLLSKFTPELREKTLKKLSNYQFK